MKRGILVAILVLFSLMLVGCSQSIKEVKTADYVDETVTLSGIVEGSFKIGEISGFTLVDKNDDKIFVNSKTVPEDGTKITITGTIKKGPLGLDYYLEE